VSLIPVLLALLPVTVLIVFGGILRRLPGFRSEEFWAGAEKLAYYCLLPVLLVTSVAEVDVGHVPLARLAAALVIPTVFVSMGIVVFRRVVARDLPAFTSVLQGGIRFNTYIGLSLAASLFGAEGSAVAAIVAAILVPTVNIVSSLGFEFLRTGPTSLLALLRAIVTNPLVLGVRGRSGGQSHRVRPALSACQCARSLGGGFAADRTAVCRGGTADVLDARSCTGLRRLDGHQTYRAAGSVRAHAVGPCR
jgi:fumarate reductase subunit D